MALHDPPVEADPLRPFKGTARYYSRYRPAYPKALHDFLADHVFPRGARVLDLGCGPGTLALPLAERGLVVDAVDPELEMLAEGSRIERMRAGAGPPISWRRGSDATLAAWAPDSFSGCTMGRSFHWMDRPRLLQQFDRLLMRRAAIAVVTLYEPGFCAWADVARARVQDLLGPWPAEPPAPTDQDIFAASAFSAIEQRTFPGDTLDLSIEDIVGLELSCSYASAAALGKHYEAFVASLRADLAALAPGGVFRQPYVCDVLVARRPE